MLEKVLQVSFFKVAAFAALAVVVAAGCDKVERTGGKMARKGGELVGKGAAEFFGGLGDGVQEVADGKVPDALSAIRTRKSVRKFDPSREVDQATVEKLLKAAMCAPSALDKRPWEFLVVRDPAKLKALADNNPYCRVGNGAKLAIIVCGNAANGDGWWVCDCSAATMNLLLAAHSLGLGAIWTGVYPGEERIAAVRGILGIPEGYVPLNIVPVGYPAEDPQPKDKWDEKKVHYDIW